MKKAVLISFVMVVIAVVVYLQGAHIEKYSPDALADHLIPHLIIDKPDGEGVFPTIVHLHGCGGTDLGDKDWASILVAEGFAVIRINSMAHRGINDFSVCKGYRLWGQERAGDLIAVLPVIKQLPFVDSQRLGVFGVSHGGWTVMDALSLTARGEQPVNLKYNPDNVFDGVKAIHLNYPYCSFPAKTNQDTHWLSNIPTQVLMVEEDSFVDTQQCMAIFDQFQGRGYPVEYHVYSGVTHAFDLREEDLAGGSLKRDEVARQDAVDRVIRFFTAYVK